MKTSCYHPPTATQIVIVIVIEIKLINQSPTDIKAKARNSQNKSKNGSQLKANKEEKSVEYGRNQY